MQRIITSHTRNAITMITMIVWMLVGAQIFAQQGSTSGENQDASREMAARSSPRIGSPMTRQEMRAYERQRVTLELRGVYPRRHPWHVVSVSNSWRDWEAYQGFVPLAEEEFFRLTGHLKEAAEAASYHRVNSILTWGGLAATLLGGLTVYADQVNSSYLERGRYTAAGVILGSVGLVALTAAGVRAMNNWAPYGQARLAAEEYNDNLQARLRGSTAE